MGSGTFRSIERRRSEDVAVFTDGLAEGESILYWKRLPHSVTLRMTSESSKVKFDKRGRAGDFQFDLGRAGRVRVVEGIVDWTIFDEHGKPIPWEYAKADELLDGLPTELLSKLSMLIGAGDEPLAEPVDEEQPEGETQGEDSAASSLLPLRESSRLPAGSPTSS